MALQITIFYNIIVILFLLAIIILSFIVYESRRKNLQKDIPIKDERISRIVQKSATISFYIGLFSMSFLLVMLIIGYEFFNVAEIGALNVLELVTIIISL